MILFCFPVSFAAVKAFLKSLYDSVSLVGEVTELNLFTAFLILFAQDVTFSVVFNE